MTNLKRYIGLIPELYFFLIVLFITLVEPDWKSIVGIILLVVQLFIRNKILGYLILSIITFYTLWILGAILSDLQDYGVFDIRALKFVVRSGWFVILNFVMAGFLFKKYSKYSKSLPSNQSSLS